MAPPLENADRGGAQVLESPFPCLQVDLSPDDLRETAYELFLAAYEFQSSYGSPSKEPVAASPLKSGAVRRFKKALTLGKKKSSSKQLGELELMRLQMEISEKSDLRTKKALNRAMAGRPSRPLIVPLELLQHLGPADFIDFREYKRWQKRQLKALEAGLLSTEKENATPGLYALKQAIQVMVSCTQDAGKHSEAVQALRHAVAATAGDDLHWADCYPFNVYLYEMLLRAIFDSLEETAFVVELDEVIQLVKITWSVLGLNKLLHRICFVWVLFRQFVVTGQSEGELLRGAEIEMLEITNQAGVADDYIACDLLNSTFTCIQAWADQRLLTYHTNFSGGGKGIMEPLVAVAILAAQAIHKSDRHLDLEDESDLASNRVGIYIQSSLRYGFDHIVAAHDRRDAAEFLAKLAGQTSSLLLREKELFSPTWKYWHPHPTSVAAATLHSCYRLELRKFLSGLTEISAQALQTLQSAAELEKKLVQQDMDDKAVFDTRSAIIPTMTPFTLDTDLEVPLTQWIHERLSQLEAWLHRNAQQEEWSPNGTREHYALSVVEMLRMVEEVADAFFSLPVSQHRALLNRMVSGVDSALMKYIDFCLIDCENKPKRAPNPAARRRKEFSVSLMGKVNEAWQSKQEVFGLHKGKASADKAVPAETQEKKDAAPPSLQVVCVRINSIDHIREELEFLEKKICFKWQEIPFTKEPKQIKLQQTRMLCAEAIHRLCDVAAYNVVSTELGEVFWQGLYIPSVAKARVGTVVDELNARLEVVAELVPGRLRNQVVNYLMMAALQEFSRVVADVHSTRSLSSSDITAMGEDLAALKELFKADGEGLPADVVETAAEPIAELLASIPAETKLSSKLEANLKMIMGKSKPPQEAPPQLQGATAKMSSALGYKCHAMASKLVKRTYSFSKR